jgi:hypothetical protein
MEFRFREKRGKNDRVSKDFNLENQGQNLALIVMHVPSLLDSGLRI